MNWRNNFGGGGGAVGELPMPVSNFQAYQIADPDGDVNNLVVKCEWGIVPATEQTTGVFHGIRIVYKADSLPESITDGDFVEVGNTVTTTNIGGLTQDTTYHFRVFTMNSDEQGQTITYESTDEVAVIYGEVKWARSAVPDVTNVLSVTALASYVSDNVLYLACTCDEQFLGTVVDKVSVFKINLLTGELIYADQVFQGRGSIYQVHAAAFTPRGDLIVIEVETSSTTVVTAWAFDGGNDYAYIGNSLGTGLARGSWYYYTMRTQFRNYRAIVTHDGNYLVSSYRGYSPGRAIYFMFNVSDLVAMSFEGATTSPGDTQSQAVPIIQRSDGKIVTFDSNSFGMQVLYEIKLSPSLEVVELVNTGDGTSFFDAVGYTARDDKFYYATSPDVTNGTITYRDLITGQLGAVTGGAGGDATVTRIEIADANNGLFSFFGDEGASAYQIKYGYQPF